MPQIYMIIGPADRDGRDIEKYILTRAALGLLVPELIETVENAFGIKGFSDVAFTACEPAFYTKDEADVQIEIRYTAGEDEYNRGKPFDPSLEEQLLLEDQIHYVFDKFLEKYKLPHLSLSVWCKPHYKSLFKLFDFKLPRERGNGNAIS